MAAVYSPLEPADHCTGILIPLPRLAPLDTRSGQVWGEIAPRKRQVEFLALLEQIDADLPACVTQVYLVLDNVRMHTGKQVLAWLAKHSRFTLVHPPVHCSWMN